jgi:lipoate-protein ligase A
MAFPLRGSYKTPGGKLVTVAVYLATEGSVIERVEVAGDFFLEPDEALCRIETALAGASADLSVAGLAKLVDQALAPGDTLVGFDSKAVATAVRRALGRSSTWADHTFALIEDDPRSPLMHMALDQVLAEELAAGRRGPTLRFWQWAAGAVVLGSYQSLANEVDAAGVQRHRIEVVRRASGGGAMFVEPGNTITYSLVVSETLVDGMSFQDSYAFLDAWCVGALQAMGVDATYQPINDIASPAGKIAGAAQKRFAGGAVLHHVTMAYDIDVTKMLEVLRIGQEKIRDKGTKSAAKRVDPLRSQTGLSREAVAGALTTNFAALYGLEPASLTPAELARAELLVHTKYGTQAWLERVP